MRNPDTTIFVEVENTRESYYRLIATPEAFRRFVDSLSSSLISLPSPLQEAHDMSLSGVEAADADGSQREVFLSLRVEPSLDWWQPRHRQRVRRDWLVSMLFFAVVAFAIFGFGTFIRWLISL
jgi:hypothetical protein